MSVKILTKNKDILSISQIQILYNSTVTYSNHQTIVKS